MLFMSWDCHAFASRCARSDELLKEILKEVFKRYKKDMF